MELFHGLPDVKCLQALFTFHSILCNKSMTDGDCSQDPLLFKPVSLLHYNVSIILFIKSTPRFEETFSCRRILLKKHHYEAVVGSFRAKF